MAAGWLGAHEASAQAVFSTGALGGGDQDANVGLDSTKTYFNAINVNGGNLTINGVNFIGNNGNATWSFANFPNALVAENASTLTGQFGSLEDSFRYGAVPATQSMTLTGLTPGETYITTFYSPNWDQGNATARTSAISSTSGASGTYNQNPGASLALSILRHTFVASGTSETVSFNNTGAAGSTHLYGFTTEQAFNNDWTSGADWTTASWSVAQPNGVGDNANLPAQGSPTTLNLDAPRTIGHFQFNGANAWTLSGANALTLQADIGGASVLGASAGSHVISTPVTLNSPLLKTGTGSVTLSGALTANANNIAIGAGNLTLTASSAQTLGGIISGAGSFTQAAASPSANSLALLTGANTYTGGTSITGGAIRFQNATAAGTGTVTIGAGAGAQLWWNTGSSTFANNIVINSASTVSSGDATPKPALYADGGGGGFSTYNLSGTVTLNHASSSIGGHNSNNITITGPVTGPGGLVKGLTRTDENSTLTLMNAANNFAGNTTVNRGTLRAGASNATGTGVFTVAAGATWNLGADAQTIQGLNGSGNVTRSGFVSTGSDGASLISTSKNYVRKLDFGDSGGATVNSVVFNTAGPSGTGYSLNAGALYGEANGGVVPDGYGRLVDDFYYNASNSLLTYTGLTPGRTYEAVVYTQNPPGSWSGRPQNAVFTNGADVQNLNGTEPHLVGYYAFRFAATGTSASIGMNQTGAGTFHWFASTLEDAGAAALTLGTAADFSFSGVISGGTALVKQGTGTQVLGGVNTYTGGTTVNAGTLQLNSAAGGAGGTLSGAGSITVNNGGTLLGNAFNALGHSTGHPNDSITVAAGGNLRAGAGIVLSMPYDLNIVGGTVSSVDGGDPSFGSYFLDGSGDYNFTSSAGGTAATLSAQRVNLSGAPRTFNVTDGPGAVDLNVTGTLIGTGGLTKAGAGTMVLSGANTYSGSTSFSGGIVNVANLTNYGVAGSLGLRNPANETPGGAGSISMVFRGGTLQYTGSTPQSTDRMIRISTTGGGGTIDASGTGAGTISFTAATSVDQWENGGNRTLTLTGSNTGNNLFALGMADAGGQNSLVKSGVGKWVLSSNGATYAGATTINGGTLEVTGGNGIGNFSPLTLANTSGTRLVLSANEQIGSLNGGGASGGNVELNGNTLSAGLNNSSTVYSGLITGPGGSLVKNGSGTLELTNAANSFTGKVGVHGGTLLLTGTSGTLGMGNPAAAADAITLGQAGNAGTLRVAGGNLSPGAGRGITVAGVGGTVDVDSGLTFSLDSNIAGAFVGSTFTKAGAGTFNLTGNATFNALAVRGGVYNQNGGNTMVLESSGTGLLVDTGVYNLNGGTLRADLIQTANGGTINWGSATITPRQYGSGSNVYGDLTPKFDHTSGGYQNVKVGTSLSVEGGLATSSGSTVRLHGSPSFYISSDVLFDNLVVDGNLDLTNGGTLEVEINPYLLRPFSPSGTGVETGSLPLVIASGGITGTFASFTGVGNDGLGFSEFAGPFSGVGSLTENTWYLEYRTGVAGSQLYLPTESGFAGTYDVVFFHYNVAGYVPEPGSFGLMVVGAYALRLARRRRA